MNGREGEVGPSCNLDGAVVMIGRFARAIFSPLSQLSCEFDTLTSHTLRRPSPVTAKEDGGTRIDKLVVQTLTTSFNSKLCKP